MNADGSGLTQLTRHGTFSIAPAWSPDGTKIVYSTLKGAGDHLRLYVMNADGSGKQRLTKSKFYETNPVFSPDGTRIAFTGDRDNRNLSKQRLGRGFELYTMATDGGDLIRVTDNRLPELFPDWQPLP